MTRSRIIDTEIVELSRTIQAVTEEAGANTLPITGAHREGIASECKILAIGAVVELVDIVQTVGGNAQIKLVKVSIQHWVDMLPDDPDCPVHVFMTLLCVYLVRDAALGPHHLLVVIFKEHLLCACCCYCC